MEVSVYTNVYACAYVYARANLRVCMRISDRLRMRASLCVRLCIKERLRMRESMRVRLYMLRRTSKIGVYALLFGNAQTHSQIHAHE